MKNEIINYIKIIKFNLTKKWKMENELEKAKKKKHYSALGGDWNVWLGRGAGFAKKIGYFCRIKTYVLRLNLDDLIHFLLIIRSHLTLKHNYPF